MQPFIYKRISSIPLRVGIFCSSFRGQHPIGEKSTKVDLRLLYNSTVSKSETKQILNYQTIQKDILFHLTG